MAESPKVRKQPADTGYPLIAGIGYGAVRAPSGSTHCPTRPFRRWAGYLGKSAPEACRVEVIWMSPRIRVERTSDPRINRIPRLLAFIHEPHGSFVRDTPRPGTEQV